MRNEGVKGSSVPFEGPIDPSVEPRVSADPEEDPLESLVSPLILPGSFQTVKDSIIVSPPPTTSGPPSEEPSLIFPGNIQGQGTNPESPCDGGIIKTLKLYSGEDPQLDPWKDELIALLGQEEADDKDSKATQRQVERSARQQAATKALVAPGPYAKEVLLGSEAFPGSTPLARGFLEHLEKLGEHGEGTPFPGGNYLVAALSEPKATEVEYVLGEKVSRNVTKPSDLDRLAEAVLRAVRTNSTLRFGNVSELVLKAFSDMLVAAQESSGGILPPQRGTIYEANALLGTKNLSQEMALNLARGIMTMELHPSLDSDAPIRKLATPFHEAIRVLQGQGEGFSAAIHAHLRDLGEAYLAVREQVFAQEEERLRKRDPHKEQNWDLRLPSAALVGEILTRAEVPDLSDEFTHRNQIEQFLDLAIRSVQNTASLSQTLAGMIVLEMAGSAVRSFRLSQTPVQCNMVPCDKQVEQLIDLLAEDCTPSFRGGLYALLEQFELSSPACERILGIMLQVEERKHEAEAPTQAPRLTFESELHDPLALKCLGTLLLDQPANSPFVADQKHRRTTLVEQLSSLSAQEILDSYEQIIRETRFLVCSLDLDSLPRTTKDGSYGLGIELEYHQRTNPVGDYLKAFLNKDDANWRELNTNKSHLGLSYQYLCNLEEPSRFLGDFAERKSRCAGRSMHLHFDDNKVHEDTLRKIVEIFYPDFAASRNGALRKGRDGKPTWELRVAVPPYTTERLRLQGNYILNLVDFVYRAGGTAFSNERDNSLELLTPQPAARLAALHMIAGVRFNDGSAKLAALMMYEHPNMVSCSNPTVVRASFASSTRTELNCLSSYLKDANKEGPEAYLAGIQRFATAVLQRVYESAPEALAKQENLIAQALRIGLMFDADYSSDRLALPEWAKAQCNLWVASKTHSFSVGRLKEMFIKGGPNEKITSLLLDRALGRELVRSEPELLADRSLWSGSRPLSEFISAYLEEELVLEPKHTTMERYLRSVSEGLQSIALQTLEATASNEEISDYGSLLESISATPNNGQRWLATELLIRGNVRITPATAACWLKDFPDQFLELLDRQPDLWRERLVIEDLEGGSLRTSTYLKFPKLFSKALGERLAEEGRDLATRAAGFGVLIHHGSSAQEIGSKLIEIVSHSNADPEGVEAACKILLQHCGAIETTHEQLMTIWRVGGPGPASVVATFVHSTSRMYDGGSMTTIISKGITEHLIELAGDQERSRGLLQSALQHNLLLAQDFRSLIERCPSFVSVAMDFLRSTDQVHLPREMEIVPLENLAFSRGGDDFRPSLFSDPESALASMITSLKQVDEVVLSRLQQSLALSLDRKDELAALYGALLKAGRTESDISGQAIFVLARLWDYYLAPHSEASSMEHRMALVVLNALHELPGWPSIGALPPARFLSLLWRSEEHESLAHLEKYNNSLPTPYDSSVLDDDIRNLLSGSRGGYSKQVGFVNHLKRMGLLSAQTGMALAVAKPWLLPACLEVLSLEAFPEEQQRHLAWGCCNSYHREEAFPEAFAALKEHSGGLSPRLGLELATGMNSLSVELGLKIIAEGSYRPEERGEVSEALLRAASNLFLKESSVALLKGAFSRHADLLHFEAGQLRHFLSGAPEQQIAAMSYLLEKNDWQLLLHKKAIARVALETPKAEIAEGRWPIYQEAQSLARTCLAESRHRPSYLNRTLDSLKSWWRGV